MADKGWSKRFDEPIVLDDGTTLTTLREAIEYLAKTVPKAERSHPSVLTASDHLTWSAEKNYPMAFARMATLQAIHRHRAGLQSRSQRPGLHGQCESGRRLELEALAFGTIPYSHSSAGVSDHGGLRFMTLIRPSPSSFASLMSATSSTWCCRN
jgi:hypothetical protein